MQDYIDILLTAVEGNLFSHLGKDYFLSLRQEEAAWNSLRATLSEEQAALLDAYQDIRNSTAIAYGDAYARQAFLLAREIYR